MQRVGLILMALWALSALAAWFHLVPGAVELVGLALGAVGVVLLFLTRKKPS